MVSDRFIAAHVVGAFQPEPDQEGDPGSIPQLNIHHEQTLGFRVPNLYGCLIFQEVLREYENIGQADIEAHNVVHEIGHLFGDDFDHFDGGVMQKGSSWQTNKYSPKSLAKIRSMNFDH